MKTFNLRNILTGLAIAVTPTSKIADEDELVEKCGFAAYNCQG